MLISQEKYMATLLYLNLPRSFLHCHYTVLMISPETPKGQQDVSSLPKTEKLGLVFSRNFLIVQKYYESSFQVYVMFFKGFHSGAKKLDPVNVSV